METNGTPKKERISTKLKKKWFLEAYKLSLGNISVACEKARITRNTFYRWTENDKAFAEKCIEIDEGEVDFTETMLKKNIREGKEASIFFHLKTKGKSRGYIESSQLQISQDPWTEAALRSIEGSNE